MLALTVSETPCGFVMTQFTLIFEVSVSNAMNALRLRVVRRRDKINSLIALMENQVFIVSHGGRLTDVPENHDFIHRTKRGGGGNHWSTPMALMRIVVIKITNKGSCSCIDFMFLASPLASYCKGFKAYSHRASASVEVVALILGMDLGAISQHQHQCQSVWTYQLKPLYSFQSINTDADGDTECEHDLIMRNLCWLTLT